MVYSQLDLQSIIVVELMKSFELILFLFGVAGITLSAFALYFLLTFKKKRAYLERMKQELSEMRELGLPKHVHDKYRPETISENLKKFLEEKEEDIESLVARLRKTELWADAEIYYKIAMYYYGRKNYDSAINCFEKTLDINPDHKMVYYNMGGIYLVLENWEKAIDWFNKSIERNEEKANSYYNLGWIYDELEDYEKAVESYEQSSEGAYDSIYNKACALAKWGKEDEAIRELEKISDKDDIREWILMDADLENLRRQGKIASLLELRSPKKD